MTTAKRKPAQPQSVDAENLATLALLRKLINSRQMLRCAGLMEGDRLFEDVQKVGRVQRFSCGTPQHETAFAIVGALHAVGARIEPAGGMRVNPEKLAMFIDSLSYYPLDGVGLAEWAQDLAEPEGAPRNAQEFFNLAVLAGARIQENTEALAQWAAKPEKTSDDIDKLMRYTSALKVALSALASDE